MLAKANFMIHETADDEFFFDEELIHGYFVQYPSALFRSEKFNPTAKTLYGLLLTYAGPGNQSWPGQKRLSEELAVSENTVRTAMKELIAGGLLSVKRRGQGQANIYKVKKFKNSGSRTSESAVQETPEPQNLRFKNRKVSGSKTSDFEVELDSVKLDSEQLNKEEEDAAANDIENQKLFEEKPDPVIGEIFKTLENLWGTLSAPVSDKVKALVVEYGTDWVFRAVTEGALHQAKNIVYIERILDNWKRNGIREVQSARYGATGTGNRLAATGARATGQNARTGSNQQPGSGSPGTVGSANGRYANPQIAAKYDHLFERDD
jgi:DnaD/phage-associated family protein